MKIETYEVCTTFHAEPDTARIYEALAYAQDFTNWESEYANAKKELDFEVV